MIWIQFESRNFTFDAFGQDEREASMNLRKGITKHCKQYNIDCSRLLADAFNDCNVIDLEMGFYRDNEQIPI